MNNSEYRESLSTLLKEGKLSQLEMPPIAALQSFLSSHSEAIRAIYHAPQCRELWVQGEMFINGYGLNFPLAGGRADFYWPKNLGDPVVVGELKLCGSGDRHNFKGDIRPFLAIPRAFGLGVDDHLHHGNWSPLGDFYKLQNSANVNRNILHLLVLAIVTFIPGNPTNWGVYVHQMKLDESLATELPEFVKGDEATPGLRVRAWKILPSSGKENR